MPFLLEQKKVDCEEPLMKRNFLTLKERTDRYRELALALVALVQARAVLVPSSLFDIFDRAPVRANRTIWPADTLKVSPCGFVVFEEFTVTRP